MVGQHLFLNIIFSNFTVGIGREVWCDQGHDNVVIDFTSKGKTNTKNHGDFGAFAKVAVRQYIYDRAENMYVL